MSYSLASLIEAQEKKSLNIFWEILTTILLCLENFILFFFLILISLQAQNLLFATETLSYSVIGRLCYFK